MAVWHPFGFSSAARRPPPVLLPPPAGIAPPLLGSVSSAITGEAAAAAVSTAPTVLHCDPCDKEFPNQRALQQHLKTHVGCTQCAFAATQSVVLEHTATAHSTGSRWAYVSSLSTLHAWPCRTLVTQYRFVVLVPVVCVCVCVCVRTASTRDVFGHTLPRAHTCHY